jgi:hypothetical protein
MGLWTSHIITTLYIVCRIRRWSDVAMGVGMRSGGRDCYEFDDGLMFMTDDTQGAAR